jgi:hypothetical protein
MLVSHLTCTPYSMMHYLWHLKDVRGMKEAWPPWCRSFDNRRAAVNNVTRYVVENGFA